MSSGHRPLDGLTGLRGVAACWVMLMHYREVTLTQVWQFPVLDSVIANVGYGVDVFFVLSGFVMSYACEGRFSRELRWSDVCRFPAYRFAGIYPMHVVTLAQTCLARLTGSLASLAIAFWASRPDPVMAVGSVLFATLPITTADSADLLCRALSRPTAVYLGEISYSLYMVHWPVRVMIRYGLDPVGRLSRMPPVALVVLYVCTTLALALTSYRWIEIPGRAGLRPNSGSAGRLRVSPVTWT